MRMLVLLTLRHNVYCYGAQKYGSFYDFLDIC